jgi:hypothetical protein
MCIGTFYLELSEIGYRVQSGCSHVTIYTISVESESLRE